jgi:hypothetical protein
MSEVLNDALVSWNNMTRNDYIIKQKLIVKYIDGRVGNLM